MAGISRVALHIWRLQTRDLEEGASVVRMLQAINMKATGDYGLRAR